MEGFNMSAIRSIAIGLLAIGLSAAPTAQAGVQLYQGSWFDGGFGNDLVGGTGASEFFSVLVIPHGNLCNPYQPRCNFSSTPVDTTNITKVKNFNPLGDFCAPYSAFVPFGGSTMRPEKFGTPRTANGRPIPPLYRSPGHFTVTLGKLPRGTACSQRQTANGYFTHRAGSTTEVTGPGPNKGKATFFLTTNDSLRGPAQRGKPLSGGGIANTTTPMAGGAFSFGAAPLTPTMTPGPTRQGFRRTTVGSFFATFPYLYSYTYASLRNDAGNFAAGGGFFTENAENATVTIPYTLGGETVAKVVAKQGANRFGGVMQLLGRLTSKLCFFSLGGCFQGSGNTWPGYRKIGAAGYYSNGIGTVTAGKVYDYTLLYYFTAGMQISTAYVEAERFPWTTGYVTVTATRGVHKTVQRRHGYDNRTTNGRGTIQLVSPHLTRWVSPGPVTNNETGGIAIMRIKMPEPQKWLLLAAGLSLLGVLYRAIER
jgi:hypothetical protein